MNPVTVPGRPAAPARALVPLAPRDQALARLALTRQRLREALIEPADADSGDPSSPAASGSSPWWRRLRRWARRSPVLLAGLGAARSWWQAQPWGAAVEVGAREVRGSLVPLIRRQPVLSLLAAAGAGAGLVMGRRWLWRWASAQARPLPGHLAQWALAQAANPATQALLATWLLSAAKPTAAPKPPAQAFPPEGP